MNDIWTSQNRNRLKKYQLNCNNENIIKWREKIMLQMCTLN